MTGQVPTKTARERGVRMRILLGETTINALRDFVFEHRYSPTRSPGRTLTVSRLCELMVRACMPRLIRELTDEDAGHTDRLALLSTHIGDDPRRLGVEFDPTLSFDLDVAALTSRTRRGRRDLVARCVTATARH